MRDGRALRHAFETHSDYLRDSEVDDATVNFCDYGLQLTRASRAFKLWLSLRTFGVAAFRAAIDRSLDLAELARRRIEASDRLELAAPPSLGIVCFRRDGDHGLTDGLVAALEQDGPRAHLVDARPRPLGAAPLRPQPHVDRRGRGGGALVPRDGRAGHAAGRVRA